MASASYRSSNLFDDDFVNALQNQSNDEEEVEPQELLQRLQKVSSNLKLNNNFNKVEYLIAYALTGFLQMYITIRFFRCGTTKCLPLIFCCTSSRSLNAA